ncbi:hypothetical protein AAEY27_04470 [Kosakonia sp. BYX6]|uniref:Uncharacterized protein n=1 Tax=Kosakonia calanthes TaxID=3139408 RepID=A0ABZ3B7F9_9ENTR
MYDDLGSLAEKLKMSGVSFLEMNEEEGATMQAVTTTPVTTEISDVVTEAAISVASRKDASSHASAPASVPTNTLAWPKNRPTPEPAPQAFNTPANGILDSVAAITRPAEIEIRERNPVRLDQLFTVIGK